MTPGHERSQSDQIGQVLLRLKYRELAQSPGLLPDFADVEFRCYSQNGEDGILLYLFSLLGAETRKAVEICAGDGLECNAANLVINHGWQALLFDGDAAQIARGSEFYATCRSTWASPPRLVHAWITAENVNQLVAAQGFSGPVDLLSLDLDGNDYWIWQALDIIQPRAVVLEFNAHCGPDRSLSMRYQPDFALDYAAQPYRCGASLAAFDRLGRQKGYRLIGVQSLGFNAFFVREDLGRDLLPDRSPRECYERTERLRGWSPALLEAMWADGRAWQEV